MVLDCWIAREIDAGSTSGQQSIQIVEFHDAVALHKKPYSSLGHQWRALNLLSFEDEY